MTPLLSSFHYLGCKISDKLNEDMESNILKYNRSNGIIQKQFKKITKQVKQRLHNVIAKQALRYRSETWVLRNKDRRRLKTSQTRYARYLVGVTSRDRMQDDDIRDRLKMRTDEEIRDYQIKWLQHLERMDSNRVL